MAKDVREVKDVPGYVEVTRTTLPGGKVETKNKRIKVRPFVTTPATVSVKFGVTIPSSVNQYGSNRIDVMLSVPCYVEEMLDVFNDTRDLVDRLISGEIDRIESDE